MLLYLLNKFNNSTLFFIVWLKLQNLIRVVLQKQIEVMSNESKNLRC